MAGVMVMALMLDYELIWFDLACDWESGFGEDRRERAPWVFVWVPRIYITHRRE